MNDSANSLSAAAAVSHATPIQTEVVVIGAGPAGLFQVFELGLLGIKAHILDTLTKPGGQCTELYPDKPIYDIPAVPVCGAAELIERLMQQIKPFGAEFHLGEEALQLTRREDGRFTLVTSAGTVFDTGAIVVAAGVGSFQPRHLGVENAAAFEGRQIHYSVKNAADFHGRRLVIFGGGDSALDWTVDLAPKAASIALVHRRADFRGAPATAAKVRELIEGGKLRFIEGLAQGLHQEAGALRGVHVKPASGELQLLDAEHLLVFFGLAPKLGPIADWGFELHGKAIKVDTEKFQSNIPGVFAIGDINIYPGKKKLILSGFHEAALAAFAIQHHLYPAKKQFLQYTTTSPAMQKRLGVATA
ncbi:MAG TPA: NAD(P)/FAD-dependent oxidoreductase [Steroidobacteraceae bacterium]|nr:NAD(P)/FAD-dependent oxidoreductase [Steroidobacteraceae bacterium]